MAVKSSPTDRARSNVQPCESRTSDSTIRPSPPGHPAPAPGGGGTPPKLEPASFPQSAEVYAQEEGIVNVYSDESPGRQFVDQARAALSTEEVARATEIGRRLTIKETLDLARTPV